MIIEYPVTLLTEIARAAHVCVCGGGGGGDNGVCMCGRGTIDKENAK